MSEELRENNEQYLVKFSPRLQLVLRFFETLIKDVEKIEINEIF